jgi:hypothetical protein
MTTGGPIQFEKAEFAETPAAPACATCGRPIQASYYQVGNTILCSECREGFVRVVEVGKTGSSFARAFVYGAAAMLVGSVVWYVIRQATGYEIGLVAIGIGILVGKAVMRGSGGFGGKRYQALAIGLTYASIALTSVPAIVSALAEKASAEEVSPSAGPGATPAGPAGPAAAPSDPSAPPAGKPAGEAPAAPASSPSVLGLLAACAIIIALALASPFLGGFDNILGLVIIGIGLYEAWKITRYTPPVIHGPFEISAAPAVVPPSVSGGG